MTSCALALPAASVSTPAALPVRKLRLCMTRLPVSAVVIGRLPISCDGKTAAWLPAKAADFRLSRGFYDHWRLRGSEHEPDQKERDRRKEHEQRDADGIRDQKRRHAQERLAHARAARHRIDDEEIHPDRRTYE